MYKNIILFVLLFCSVGAWAQQLNHFWTPSDTLNKNRFYIGSGVALGTYGIASVGLYNAWYKDGDIGKFHYFDDRNEWENMDKYGHVMSAYFESVYAYKVAKWSGLSDDNAIWTGILTGSIVQSTIEIMDGYSNKWGFSYADMGMNVTGVLAFSLQQHFWKEQRITLKVSSTYRSYEAQRILATNGVASSSLKNRANDLFGHSFLSRYLKDYNAQTYWASINISSFLPADISFPSYLNIALGYGAENMYGGYANQWLEGVDKYVLDKEELPRYHQFYVGLDIDFTKIHTKNYILKTLGTVFNIFKLPAPAIEFNTQGEVVFHLMKI